MQVTFLLGHPAYQICSQCAIYVQTYFYHLQYYIKLIHYYNYIKINTERLHCTAVQKGYNTTQIKL